MKTVGEIYKEYKILPNLQEHQFRVASVARLIGEQHKEKINLDKLIKAALLHDMGNIIKFDLEKPIVPWKDDEEKNYWLEIQNKFRNKYGHDEHKATVTIAQEIGLNDEVVELVSSLNFSKACLYKEGSDYEKKILLYADCRVSPKGVTGLKERLEDFKNRYTGRKDYFEAVSDMDRMGYISCIEGIESELFSNLDIKPEDIMDETIDRYMKELENYPLL